MRTNSKLNLKSDQMRAALPNAFFIVLTALLLFATFLPANALAMTAHLKENAPKFIDKTQNLYGETVNSAALLHGVDPNLILAVIVAESDGNAKVVSSRGAEGLMQLMPKTARAMGATDSQDPFQNIMAGTKYLNELSGQYGFNSPGEVLVAYNMGPRRAKQWLLEHSPEEYGYVRNVIYVYRVIDDKKQTDTRLAAGDIKKICESRHTFWLAIVRCFATIVFSCDFSDDDPQCAQERSEE